MMSSGQQEAEPAAADSDQPPPPPSMKAAAPAAVAVSAAAASNNPPPAAAEDKGSDSDGDAAEDVSSAGLFFLFSTNLGMHERFLSTQQTFAEFFPVFIDARKGCSACFFCENPNGHLV